MTKQELETLVKSLKSEGHTEEEILSGFYKLYTDNKLSLKELEGIANLMGYHLSDDFLNKAKDN